MVNTNSYQLLEGRLADISFPHFRIYSTVVVKTICVIVTAIVLYVLITDQYGGAYRLHAIFAKRRLQQPIPVPKILVFTSFFRADLKKILLNVSCEVKCIYGSRAEMEEAEADAVIFHVRDLEIMDNHTVVPWTRRPEQIYAALIFESPVNMGFVINGPHGPAPDFFNVTIDYRIDPLTYFWGYGMIAEARTAEEKQQVHRMYDLEFEMLYRMKTRMALVMMSNCHAPSGRDYYLQALTEEIPVTRVGFCFPVANRTQCDRDYQSSTEVECERRMISEHFFYIAFENSVCEDYVTEKFWRLKRNIVPVVLKRSICRNLVPDSAFIAADDFDSPRELGLYLRTVADNPQLYRKFFEWRNTHYIKDHTRGLCEFCSDLHHGTVRLREKFNAHEYYSKNTCVEGYGSELLEPKRHWKVNRTFQLPHR